MSGDADSRIEIKPFFPDVGKCLEVCDSHIVRVLRCCASVQRYLLCIIVQALGSFVHCISLAMGFLRRYTKAHVMLYSIPSPCVVSILGASVPGRKEPDCLVTLTFMTCMFPLTLLFPPLSTTTKGTFATARTMARKC